MKLKIYSIVICFFVFPLATAFPCDLTSSEEYCLNITTADLNESSKDAIFSSLLYPDSDYPNHNLIEEYNRALVVDAPPDNTAINSSYRIKDCWVSFLSIFPLVYENQTLYVTPESDVLSEYNYWIYIPPNYDSQEYPETSEGDCRRIYTLTQNDSWLRYYLDGAYKGSGKDTTILTESGNLTAELTVRTNIQVDHYQWYSYCCRWYKGSCKKVCHECRYSTTSYEPDSMTLEESKNITLYTARPTANVQITNQYLNTTKGVYEASNYSFLQVQFNDSNLAHQTYYYDLRFDKKPYYFAYLEAHNASQKVIRNLHLTNQTFVVKNAQNCSILAYNHFYNLSKDCDLTLQQEDAIELTIRKKDLDFGLLWYAALFLLVIYIIYRLAKSKLGKVGLVFLILLPGVLAEDCGITNLASCLPEKMYEYLLYIINAPLLPMLESISYLLTAEVSTDIFYHTWNIIRYILSFFYIFFLLYAGYTYLTSGANPIKRAHAKDMLQNTIIMIVLIQGSYYIYGLLLNISSVMDSAILEMIDPHFFMLTADSIVNIGLEFLFTLSYTIVLFLTLLMLALRYIVVSFGVVLFPIALFLYFTPPLKSYGRFLLNILGIFIFITFIDMLIILACSMLILHPLFEHIKIVIMINAFSIVNYTLYLAIKFAMTKSSLSSIGDDIQQAVKYVGMVV